VVLKGLKSLHSLHGVHEVCMGLPPDGQVQNIEAQSNCCYP
jgi:hypothetical protein